MSSKMKDRIAVLRTLMVVTLVTVATVFGLTTYFGLSGSESSFAAKQFDSVAANAIIGIKDSFTRMDVAYGAVASMYSNYFPDESQWPFVLLPGYYETVLSIVTSLNVTITFHPFVQPEPDIGPMNQTKYEKFLFEYYDSEPFVSKPAGFPIPEFGYGGIWGVRSNNFWAPGNIYRDVTGEVPWGSSPYKVLMPAAQSINDPPETSLFYAGNFHTSPLNGPHIDKALNCVHNTTDYAFAVSHCPVLTPWNFITGQNSMYGFVTYPIMLQQNTSKMVGYIGGQFSRENLLHRVVPEHHGDIDVVITAEGHDANDLLLDEVTFTYTISSGIPTLQGYGDLHDRKYSKYGSTGNKVVVVDSTVNVAFYPRRSFVEEYETSTPIFVSIGSVCLILLCSLVFLVYDIAVSRESTQQQMVLDIKRQFVRYISHEVRTPLNTVRLGLKLFEGELARTKRMLGILTPAEIVTRLRSSIDDWIELTNDALGSSEAAVDVLSDLLNYDKIETGTLRLDVSMVAIWNVVGGIVKAFGMQAQQKSIDLKLIGSLWDGNTTGTAGSSEAERTPYSCMGVVGDVTRLAQVLRNLLSNALKFTPENGQVTVQVDWMPDGMMNSATIDNINLSEDQVELLREPRKGSIRIAVIDSGAGLSHEQLALICTEGVQFNANQLQAGQGSGLGLFISKGIVEQHGGTMVVTSDGLGTGATFTIELPLFAISTHDHHQHYLTEKEEEEEEDEEKSNTTGGALKLKDEEIGEASNSSSRRRSSRRLRVLVIDDALSNRKLLIRILKNKGYECEEAQDGEKGLAKYQEMCDIGTPPDAILCDYEMPVMIGPHAVRHMRELGCTCFIAGVTGNVMQADIDYFKEHGADTVLAKPFNTDTFESLFSQHRGSKQKPLLVGATATTKRPKPVRGRSVQYQYPSFIPTTASAATTTSKVEPVDWMDIEDV